MRRCFWLAGILAGVIALFSAAPVHAAEAEKPVRVLLVLGSPDWHDIRSLGPFLQEVLEKAGGIKVTRLEPAKDKPTEDSAHFAKLAGLKREDYDVVVMYTDSHKLGELDERALEKFILDGGGFVALHGTSKSFIDDKTDPKAPAPSPTWQKLIGARCPGHIPGLHKMNVVVTDKDHPVTKGVESFTITDQAFEHIPAEVERKVLARFKERTKVLKESDKNPNMDIVWTREIGKGKVVYTGLGHDYQAWNNPAWQKLVAQSVLWAAGKPREVKLPKLTTQPIRVLFVLGSPPFHDIRKLPPILEKVLAQVGGFQVTRLEPPKPKEGPDKPDDNAHLAKLADVKRSDYDVIVFYTSRYTKDDLQERALEKFLDEGGGIVALHGASGSFKESKFWEKTVGGTFAGHIPKTHKLQVVVAKADHPIMKGIEPFTIVDEAYRHNIADVERTVLARFKERPQETDPKANLDIVWTRNIGKGRVAYNALGHDKEAWMNPAWQKLTAQAIAWAAGKPMEVTLPPITVPEEK